MRGYKVWVPRAEEPSPGNPPTLGQLVAAYKAACRGLDDWWKAHSPNETELAALAARLKAQPEVLATIERLNAEARLRVPEDASPTKED